MKTLLRFTALLLVNKCFATFAIFIFNLTFFKAGAEIFTLGYLTGSQRTPGNLDYQRPGKTEHTSSN